MKIKNKELEELFNEIIRNHEGLMLAETSGQVYAYEKQCKKLEKEFKTKLNEELKKLKTHSPM